MSEVRRCLLLETPLALRLLVFLVQALRQRLMLPVLLALGPSTGQVQPVLEFQELGLVPELALALVLHLPLEQLPTGCLGVADGTSRR